VDKRTKMSTTEMVSGYAVLKINRHATHSALRERERERARARERERERERARDRERERERARERCKRAPRTERRTTRCKP